MTRTLPSASEHTAAPRDRLADLLGDLTAAGSFSAQRTAPPGDLHLKVRGVGALELPVPEHQAEQLCRVASPAPYGKGTKTLVDTKVRDTWQVPTSRVTIDQRRFDATLSPMLEHLRDDLGLPASCELVAELHSMLVYAPGQHFLPHQDSEKSDDMVGSLVLTLPGTFQGGELLVEHAGRRATYRGSKRSLSFVAFYPDCRHEVKAVRSGHRVVLTYNLLARNKAIPALEDCDPVLLHELAALIDEHFSTPAAGSSRSSRTGDELEQPSRLVYLLDHEYTERGFGWSRLKGDDAWRAGAMRSAAASAGCEIALALTELHETWEAYEPERRSRWGGRRYGWGSWGSHDEDEEDDEDDDEEGNGGGSEHYELGDIIESELSLASWITPSASKPERVGLAVRGDEICATTPSEDLEPYETEYEGYMGNWGNTLDRWYRRGALVLWPRSRSFAVRAEVSPRAALDELARKLRRGELAGAREDAASLASFWGRVVAGVEQQRPLFERSLRVAEALEDPAGAAMLLAPFSLMKLQPRHAAGVVGLVGRYGEAWAAELLRAWSARARRWNARPEQQRESWTLLLPQLCEALGSHGEIGLQAARLLESDSLSWLSSAVDKAADDERPSRRDRALGELVPAAVALLVAVRLSGATDLCDGVVGLLGAQREEATSWQLAYLRAAVSSRPRRLPAALLEPLAQLCALRLEARLARPSRASGDWSLDLPGRCRCELCASLAAFLRDPARSTLEWPLAKDRRRHVHERIDQAELPVRHETRHSGSPHKLLLTKDPSLFATEAAARRRDESDAAWLSKHFGPTGPPEPTNRRTSTAPRSSKEAPWRQSTTVRAASAPVRNGRGAAGKASTRSTSTRISRAQPV